MDVALFGLLELSPGEFALIACLLDRIPSLLHGDLGTTNALVSGKLVGYEFLVAAIPLGLHGRKRKGTVAVDGEGSFGRVDHLHRLAACTYSRRDLVCFPTKAYIHVNKHTGKVGSSVDGVLGVYDLCSGSKGWYLSPTRKYTH